MYVEFILNIVALGLCVGWFLSRLWPATEAVRVRNAFLIQPSRPEDFTWTGEKFPDSFQIERRPPDAFFVDVVKKIAAGKNEASWPLALHLASHLTENAQDKGPVQSDPVKSYLAIREGYGYCADFVKVYIALAHAANLAVRQWAFSFDGFGGHGHTLVEVWDREREKWLLLDVHNNIHMVDAVTGEPLSVFECRDAFMGQSAPAEVRANGPGREGFRHRDKLINYYRRGSNEWYLWWGNAINSYYAHPLVRFLERLSEGAAHLGAFALGVLPSIRVFPCAENADAIAGMYRLRNWVRTVLVAILVLLVMLTILIIRGRHR